MIFGKPPDKSIDWNIWSPIVPVKFQKCLTIMILAISVLLSVSTILILRQEIYRSAIYNVVFNGVVYRFFPEAAKILAIVLSVVISLIYISIIIFLHELLHILCYPKFGFAHTYIFLDKRTGAICPLYDGEISRERRLLSNAMPIIVLSCGIYMLSFIVTRDLCNILRITALVNFALSYADLLGILLLLRLPPKSILYLGVWRR